MFDIYVTSRPTVDVASSVFHTPPVNPLLLLAFAALFVGCLVGVTASWWHAAERRRVRRCRGEGFTGPRSKAPRVSVVQPTNRRRANRATSELRSSPTQTHRSRRALPHSVTATGGAE